MTVCHEKIRVGILSSDYDFNHEDISEIHCKHGILFSGLALRHNKGIYPSCILVWVPRSKNIKNILDRHGFTISSGLGPG